MKTRVMEGDRPLKDDRVEHRVRRGRKPAGHVDDERRLRRRATGVVREVAERARRAVKGGVHTRLAGEHVDLDVSEARGGVLEAEADRAVSVVGRGGRGC